MAMELLTQTTVIAECQQLAALIEKHTTAKGNGTHKTAIPQMEFMRESSPNTAICAVYQPILAIVLQGKKKGLAG
ncbi:AraC family transcriptional regulator N-terminal domain-containing protein [Nostoc piscinale]|uniref:AraC family transcriptional regulator N-terminal domain-containing protein n=1 Tax=Nostoc piscinale TaxID=224012 RepID=UPI001F24C854|nr:AraC family transcriptional regulator N-terminal domain-containing protein [Nostoc piscinale]